ncbi:MULTISPECIES: YcxB family protein [unclassified Microbacterium]|uniref:YcxB family protein n=1 Tax=unclassified Microbacterium TaxID=2609290 RepID=UPI00343C46F9
MTITIDEGLLRRMARDAAVYGLTRPWAIVMWVALAAGLALSFLTLGTGAADDANSAAWLPLATLGLGVVAVLATVSSARRAVRTATPPGTVVWARLEPDTLQIGADRRVSDIRYREFEGIRVGRDAVILRIRNSTAVTVVPRVLLTDDDIARLRLSVA